VVIKKGERQRERERERVFVTGTRFFTCRSDAAFRVVIKAGGRARLGSYPCFFFPLLGKRNFIFLLGARERIVIATFSVFVSKIKELKGNTSCRGEVRLVHSTLFFEIRKSH
jgi:hypothetical protein